jgi:hypothetical protein
MARGGGRGLIFLIDLVLGLYFINFGFNFIKIPTVISGIDKWIIFLGGIFLILSGTSFLRSNRYSRYNIR